MNTAEEAEQCLTHIFSVFATMVYSVEALLADGDLQKQSAANARLTFYWQEQSKVVRSEHSKQPDLLCSSQKKRTEQL